MWHVGHVLRGEMLSWAGYSGSAVPPSRGLRGCQGTSGDMGISKNVADLVPLIRWQMADHTTKWWAWAQSTVPILAPDWSSQTIANRD